MNKLFVTVAEGIYDRLDEILYKLLGGVQEIKRTENGKPYIEGNPLFFSISHSGTHGIIAICDSPVGVDLETFKNKRHFAVEKRFSPEELKEISDEKQFLLHWTAREAFIKMKGGTLARDFKSIAYTGGKIYFDGILQNCEFQQHVFEFGIVTVCTGAKV